MTKFEVLFRILLIVVIVRHCSGGECKSEKFVMFEIIFIRFHCTEKENFCANCFRWIDSFCRLDKDELRPNNETDLSKFKNITEGDKKDPHFQKCLLPYQKVDGKYIYERYAIKS